MVYDVNLNYLFIEFSKLINIKMKKQQVQQRGCLNHVVLVILSLVAYFLYSKATFPIQLNGRRPELFNSSQPEKISQFVLPKSAMKNSKLIKNDIIKNCEDLQIAKSTGLIYCGTATGSIIQINPNNEFSHKVIGSRNGGDIYGIRLSTDQKTLYFINDNEGLCKINLQTYETQFLIGSYNGQKLLGLNCIEVHPEKSHIVYFSQSSYLFPAKLLQKDVLLSHPLGRLFQFDNNSKQLRLVFDGLYFANGLVFQKYNGEATILVAESSRYRIQRIFIQGQNYGKNVTVIQNLPVLLDNMKLNQNGQIWVGGPVIRDQFSTFSQHNPIIRQLVILLPTWLVDSLIDTKLMGGLKIQFLKQTLQAKANYYIFESLKDFYFITTIVQSKNMLYMSSLVANGILVVPKADLFQQRQQTQRQNIKIEQQL